MQRSICKFKLSIIVSMMIFVFLICQGFAYAGAQRDYEKAKAKLTEFKKLTKLHKYRDKWFKQIKRFERIVDKYPDHKRSCDSLYNIGMLYSGLSKVSRIAKDRREAAEAFEKLAGRCPDYRLADDGYFHAATIYLSLGDSTRAKNLCARSITRHPKGDTRPDCEALLTDLGGERSELSAKVDTSQLKVIRPESGPIILHSAKVEAVEGNTELHLAFSRLAPMTHGNIPASGGRPRRLYFDFANTKLDPGLSPILIVGDSRVSAIRIGQFKETVARIVFEVTAKAGSFGLANEVTPAKTIITIKGKGSPPPVVAAVAVPMKDRKAKPAEVAERPVKREKEEKEKSEHRDEGVGSIIESNSEPAPAAKIPVEKEEKKPAKVPDLLRVRTVVIDAGHGGEDEGAHGKLGTKEKDIVLKIAKKLKSILEKEQKLNVIMTRESDKTMGLFDRTKIANDANADLFVSIHCNGNRRRKFEGVETFYLNNSSDSYSRRLAKRENEVFGKEVSDLDFILTDLSMNANISDSIMAAEIVQKSMMKRLRRHYKGVEDRGVRRAVFHVLLYARMPAMLVEASFITNPKEEKRLRTRKYRDHVARGIAEGIKLYSSKLQKMASSR